MTYHIHKCYLSSDLKKLPSLYKKKYGFITCQCLLGSQLENQTIKKSFGYCSRYGNNIGTNI